MERLEIVTLRQTGEVECDMALELLHQIETSSDSTNYEIKIYRHSKLNQDLSIHIRWVNDDLREENSALGEQLVHNLRDFGMIHRAVWIEETMKSHE